MSPSESAAVSTLKNDSVESIPYPSDISDTDTLPDLEDDHATSLSKLQVSDGDFYTKAVVNGKFPEHKKQGKA